MLIDTHAHLFWDSYKQDLGQVLQRAKDADVKTIINVGTDTKTSSQALKQAEQISKLTVYSSIGIHPHDAAKYNINSDESLPAGRQGIHEDIKKLESIYHSNPQKVIAVGECGLDYFFREEELRSFESNPDWMPASLSIDQVENLQRQLLKAQVDLAKQLNLPLLIHCRNSPSAGSAPTAWNEIWEFIDNWYGILHCYSGDEKATQKALNSNFLISFPATITYPKNEYLRQVTKEIPLEKIVLETDSPFLPPQSQRGRRNEPATVREIAELIAQLRGVSVEELAYQTTSNFNRLFAF